MLASQVALLEGVTPDHVYGVARRFTAQDYGVTCPGRGRKKKLDDRHKRHILRSVVANPFMSIPCLLNLCAPHVSHTTLRTFLKNEGIMHKHAAMRPYLTEAHAQGRHAWALEHQNKDLEFWRKVLFTDESTVERGAGAINKWVFRPVGMFSLPLPSPLITMLTIFFSGSSAIDPKYVQSHTKRTHHS